MNEKHYLTLALGAIVLIGLSLFTVFGDRGLVDLVNKRALRDRIIADNRHLREQNLELKRVIKRLRDDDKYIEWIARTELKMVGRDEVILIRQ